MGGLIAQSYLPQWLVDSSEEYHYHEHTLSELPINVVAYTVPWALVVGRDWRLWLMDFNYAMSPSGTVCMRIVRLEEDLFAVDAKTLDGKKYRRKLGAPRADDTPAHLTHRFDALLPEKISQMEEK